MRLSLQSRLTLHRSHVDNLPVQADWMEVPTNTMIIITPKMNVLQIPILDEYSPIDRPHPCKAPRAIPTQPMARASACHLPFSLEECAHPASPLQHLYLQGDVRLRTSREDGDGLGGASVRGQGNTYDRTSGDHGDGDRGTQEGDFLEKAQQRNRRREGSTQRSPAFALHKGFPPNSHVGLGVGNGNSGNVALAGNGGK